MRTTTLNRATMTTGDLCVANSRIGHELDAAFRRHDDAGARRLLAQRRAVRTELGVPIVGVAGKQQCFPATRLSEPRFDVVGPTDEQRQAKLDTLRKRIAGIDAPPPPLYHPRLRSGRTRSAERVEAHLPAKQANLLSARDADTGRH